MDFILDQMKTFGVIIEENLTEKEKGSNLDILKNFSTHLGNVLIENNENISRMSESLSQTRNKMESMLINHENDIGVKNAEIQDLEKTIRKEQQFSKDLVQDLYDEIETRDIEIDIIKKTLKEYRISHGQILRENENLINSLSQGDRKSNLFQSNMVTNKCFSSEYSKKNMDYLDNLYNMTTKSNLIQDKINNQKSMKPFHGIVNNPKEQLDLNTSMKEDKNVFISELYNTVKQLQEELNEKRIDNVSLNDEILILNNSKECLEHNIQSLNKKIDKQNQIERELLLNSKKNTELFDKKISEMSETIEIQKSYVEYIEKRKKMNELTNSNRINELEVMINKQNIRINELDSYDQENKMLNCQAENKDNKSIDVDKLCISNNKDTNIPFKQDKSVQHNLPDNYMIKMKEDLNELRSEILNYENRNLDLNYELFSLKKFNNENTSFASVKRYASIIGYVGMHMINHPSELYDTFWPF